MEGYKIFLIGKPEILSENRLPARLGQRPTDFLNFLK